MKDLLLAAVVEAAFYFHLRNRSYWDVKSSMIEICMEIGWTPTPKEQREIVERVEQKLRS